MPTSLVPTRATALVLVAILVASSPVGATELISRAREAGTRISLQAPCIGSDTYLSGRQAADQYSTGNGWLIGGLLIPLVGLVALASNGGDPPPAVMTTVAAEDRDCYSAGYRAQSAANDRRKGLVGFGINLALAVVLVAATGEE